MYICKDVADFLSVILKTDMMVIIIDSVVPDLPYWPF